MLVYGIFLVIVGVTATAQTMLVSSNFTSSTMQSVVGTDAALIRSVVNTYVQPGDLDADGPSATRRPTLEADFAASSDAPRSCASSCAARTGRSSSATGPTSAVCPPARRPDFRTAAEGGTIAAGIADVGASEAAGPPSRHRASCANTSRSRPTAGVQAVVGVWRDAVPILAELDRLRRDVVVTTLIAALVAAVDPVPRLPLRAGPDHPPDRRPRRRDATRPVDRPAQPRRARRRAGPRRRAGARTAGRPIGIALIDIDGFRLLNETYGHAAGDRALLAVAEVLRIGASGRR